MLIPIAVVIAPFPILTWVWGTWYIVHPDQTTPGQVHDSFNIVWKGRAQPVLNPKTPKELLDIAEAAGVENIMVGVLAHVVQQGFLSHLWPDKTWVSLDAARAFVMLHDLDRVRAEAYLRGVMFTRTPIDAAITGLPRGG